LVGKRGAGKSSANMADIEGRTKRENKGWGGKKREHMAKKKRTLTGKSSPVQRSAPLRKGGGGKTVKGGNGG